MTSNSFVVEVTFKASKNGSSLSEIIITEIKEAI